MSCTRTGTRKKFVFMATISLITAQYEEVGQIQIYQTAVNIKSKRSRRSSIDFLAAVCAEEETNAEHSQPPTPNYGTVFHRT